MIGDPKIVAGALNVQEYCQERLGDGIPINWPVPPPAFFRKPSQKKRRKIRRR